MPRKSKKKQNEDVAITATPEATLEVPCTDSKSSHSTLETDEMTMPRQTGPYEDRRKDMQRRLQKLVLSMRAAGSSEFDIKNEVNKEKRKEERKIIALEEKRANEEKACSNDVIIIPVAWKRNHLDKIRVDAACDNVRRALHMTGLKPWLDCRREYSPGQKFAYWEHMGLKFRIEIGPDDVAANVCRVVRSEKPGAYLEHQREKPEMNLQAIIRTLAGMGLEKCRDMNTSLMSSESLVESSEEPQPLDSNNVVEEDDLAGNAVIPERKPAGNSTKKFRRF